MLPSKSLVLNIVPCLGTQNCLILIAIVVAFAAQCQLTPAWRQVRPKLPKYQPKMTPPSELKVLLRALERSGMKLNDLKFVGKQDPQVLDPLPNLHECGGGTFRTEYANSFNCSGVNNSRRKSRGQPSRVSGGFHVGQGMFPSFVSLIMRFERFKKRNEFTSCGGVLISNQMIITANHCAYLNGTLTVGVAAFLGITEFDDSTYIPMKEVRTACLPPETESKNLFNDFAIMILKKKIEFSRNVQPACVHWDRTHLDDAQCFVVGMGKKFPEDDKLDKLMALGVRRNCPRGYPTPVQGLTCYLAANDRIDGSACEGDSGGPVICMDSCSGEDKQFAVAGVSYGRAKCPRYNATWYATDYHQIHEYILNLIKQCG